MGIRPHDRTQPRHSSVKRVPVAPPLLAPGARVALLAPAGPLREEVEFGRALANARALGWEPVLARNARSRAGYLAGTDEQRLSDLNDMIRDATIDGIWCLRGGYGSMRLLTGIDYAALRARPRALIGYSDITALHLAVHARCDIITFHGPTARSALSPFSRHSLERAVQRGADPCGAWSSAHALRGGRATGRLEGGNLAIVTALIGTPYAARLDGAILVLEDVNEPVYRIDRMLRQLALSGALGRLRGLVFGSFTERGVDDDEGERPLVDVLREAAQLVGGPCLAGVPVGHLEDQWTLPLGATAVLDADALTLSVESYATT